MKTRRTIVITGASQGIGAGLVPRCIERGYNVVATSRKVSTWKELPVSDRLLRIDGDVADPAAERLRSIRPSSLLTFST